MQSNTSDEVLVIDRSNEIERYRYTCPRGHIDWDKTNAHIWCRGCRRQAENGDDVDPEYWEIHDKSTGDAIPWEQVETIEPEPRPELAGR